MKFWAKYFIYSSTLSKLSLIKFIFENLKCGSNEDFFYYLMEVWIVFLNHMILYCQFNFVAVFANVCAKFVIKVYL